MPNELFGCVETEKFAEQIEKLTKSYDRFFQVHNAITWALSRNPTIGSQVPGYDGFNVFKTSRTGGMPNFWVVYEFDEEEECVTLISIRPSMDEQDDF